MAGTGVRAPPTPVRNVGAFPWHCKHEAARTALPGQEGTAVSYLLRGHESDPLSFHHCADRTLCAQLPGSLCGPPAACSSPFPTSLRMRPHVPAALASLHLTSSGINLLYNFSSINSFPPNPEQLQGQGLPCPHQSSRFCIHCVRAVGSLGGKFWTR